MQPPYSTYRSCLRRRFGAPVLKVSINAGFSCPNRDGTLSSEGCLFCDNRAFSPRAECREKPDEQLRHAIARSENRFRFFLPYLQPYTNTYAEVGVLRKIYESLLVDPRVIGLSVGTRPDCLAPRVRDYLESLNERTYLSVELGLQSANNRVLREINRGHTFEDFQEAVTDLAQRKIEIVAHIMIGLPGDTVDSILNTADQLSRLPVSGIKIHQLMIIRGTPLETRFRRGEVEVYTLERYAETVKAFLGRLRKDQVIHRIMADSREEFGLVAPGWSANKPGSLKYIHDCLRGIRGSEL